MTEQQKAKRELLKTLSAKAKEIRDSLTEEANTAEEAMYWMSRTINFMLLRHVYDTNGATEFNTFNQWKEKGATIKKGAKAFLVWGQPKGTKKSQDDQSQDNQENEEEGEEENSFFPLCYLFSDKQVTTAEEIAADKKRHQDNKATSEAEKEDSEAVQLDEVLY
jgi:antirestriction protein ArdC